jgi:hypothetical protein
MIIERRNIFFISAASVIGCIIRSKKGARREGERLSNAICLGALALKAALVCSLRFVHDHLRRRFAHFQLGAHLLNLRGLLIQLGDHGLNFDLQLIDARLLFLNFLLLFRDFVRRRVSSPS